MYQQAGLPEEAEHAYNQSLAVMVRHDNHYDQASTLGALGVLYKTKLQRPEEAVRFFQRAAEIYGAIGNHAREGITLSALADALHQLQRLEEAREAINKSLQCQEPFGLATEPWKTWNILAGIETDAGYPAAAVEAQIKARELYLDYRRNGGENHISDGRLAQEVYQCLVSGQQAKAASLLRRLSANPSWANQLQFLTALQDIAAGSRDPALADDLAIHYAESTEIRLLIEALEEKSRPLKGQIDAVTLSNRLLKVICIRLSHIISGRHL